MPADAGRLAMLSSRKGVWLSWLERCLHTAEVTGSNPVTPTKSIVLTAWSGLVWFTLQL